MSDASNESASIEEGIENIEAKILHSLEVFPYLSRGMIQQGLGPGCQPKFWDPVLQRLVKAGKIKTLETTVASPGGRALSKTIYHLPCYPYPPVKVQEIEADSVTATI